MHGARPWLALGAVPLLVLAWTSQDTRAGEIATTLLVAGSCVTLGRLLAGAAPLTLLKIGIVAMAVVDSVLVFGNQLQPANAVLVAAQPAPGLPQLQAAQLGTWTLGYGDFFSAAVVGGILAAEGRAQVAAAVATLVALVAWDQLFLVVDTLPATVPPAIVLVGMEALRLVPRARAGRRAPARSGRPWR
jgi:hypothetical protein